MTCRSRSVPESGARTVAAAGALPDDLDLGRARACGAGDEIGRIDLESVDSYFDPSAPDVEVTLGSLVALLHVDVERSRLRGHLDFSYLVPG